MDTENNKMTLISISRDTVCEFPTGDGDGSIEAQIALSYAYGDGGARSCELSCQAVSNIFYGLPIHGYGAFFMEGIAALNDAVGGVTLTILDDYPFWHMSRFYRMWPGQELTLTGEEAEVYVRARLEHQVDANELRMARQKQFLLAAIEAAKQKALENPTAILGMYDAVDEYIITDLDIAEISYLASRAVTMDFAGDLRSLEGELLLNEDAQAELHPDEEALFRLMLEVFYVEEEEN